MPENTPNELEKRLSDMQKERDAAYSLVKEMLIENEKLTNRLAIYEKPSGLYNSGWTWISKMVFLITRANKPLRSIEIIELIELQERGFHLKKNKEKYISAFLNVAMKNGRIIPYKLRGVRGYYYCLPEWIDEEMELLQEMRRKIF